MAFDDDFVLTISDDDAEAAFVSESELAEHHTARNVKQGPKRKRGEEDPSAVAAGGRKKNKQLKRQPVQSAAPPSIAEVNEVNEDDGDVDMDLEEDGTPDDVMDPNFEFDVPHNNLSQELNDLDSWGLEHVNGNTAQPTARGSKRMVDIDEIISRRESRKKPVTEGVSHPKDAADPAADLDDGKEADDGVLGDVDEISAEAGFADFDDEEILATDGFGGGAASEDEEEREQGSGVADADGLSTDGDDRESDDQSVASPVAHPDDFASDDDDDTASSFASEDEEEAAKRAAFFAEEEAPVSAAGAHVNTSGTNSFQVFSLSRPLLRGVAAANFTSPTPIQKRAIPVALAGKDVVGSAVTGSGKTAAFLLPILERLLYRPRKVPTTRVAILLPTRELAIQCYTVATQLAQYTDVTFAQLVGGFSLKEQEVSLKRRPDVVIATPGRFIDHMRNSASFVVENVEILVLDEADRMLEDGFADELDEILKTIPKGRQTMLFSATMTESVDKLIRVGMNRPVRVSVDASRATVEGLVQEFVRLRPGREDKRLASLLTLCTQIHTERVIIFFRQKKDVHRVRIIFGLYGIKAGELHGSMSQEQRVNAVSAFRAGKTSHLLATDLASRGLDIKNVLTVINYEAPQSPDIYLHRVGRTARAGKSGRACTIAAEPDRRVVRAAVKIGRAQGAQIVSRVLEAAEVDAMDDRINQLAEEVEEILDEEKEEKQLAQAEMQLVKGENLVKHEDEIKSRPRRTWFESEKDKRAARKVGRQELNGPEAVKVKSEKQKLSGKDKKRLDDRRERREGRMWRKGKGSEAQVTEERKRQHRERKSSKGRQAGSGPSKGGRKPPRAGKKQR